MLNREREGPSYPGLQVVHDSFHPQYVTAKPLFGSQVLAVQIGCSAQVAHLGQGCSQVVDQRQMLRFQHRLAIPQQFLQQWQGFVETALLHDVALEMPLVHCTGA
eukprot:s788_g2.t1